MAFRDNQYATVWEVKPTRGNSMNVRISTSYKSKQTGEYVNDFSDYCFFAGEAAKKAATLKPKDRIKLLQTSVTSEWNKETKQNRYTFTVWDIDTDVQSGGGRGGNAQQSVVPPKTPASAPTPTAGDDDGLPF